MIAVKFTHPGGRVEILASGEGQEAVLIQVCDTGQGIPSEALPHVFDRFYRADPSRNRSPKHVGGNGLGLAIAKELVEQIGYPSQLAVGHSLEEFAEGKTHIGFACGLL